MVWLIRKLLSKNPCSFLNLCYTKMRLYGWFDKPTTRVRPRRLRAEAPQPSAHLLDQAVELYEQREGDIPNRLGIREGDRRDWMVGLEIVVEGVTPPPGHFFLWRVE